MRFDLGIFPGDEVDVDGMILHDGALVLIGKAKRQENGLYRCLANMTGALVRVEVRIG